MSVRDTAPDEEKVAMGQNVEDDTDDDVATDTDDEGDIKNAETIESDLTKKYQMNLVDVYEWHLESDVKLIKLLNDKIKQSKSENEKSDEDVRLELNTKCLELKKEHNVKGVHFIEEWQTLRAKIMKNVDTVSVSELATVKKKIQDHQKKIRKMKNSTQNAIYRAMAAGLMVAGTAITTSFVPRLYIQSQETYYRDDFNDFKSILYTLENADSQGNFKIHDWMNEIHRSKKQSEEEREKVLESMQIKIENKRKTYPDANTQQSGERVWPLSKEETVRLDGYISSYETMRMFLVEYKKTDILGNIDDAALKWKTKEFDGLLNNVTTMTDSYQNGLTTTYPYEGLRNYASGAAVCFIDDTKYVEEYFRPRQGGEGGDQGLINTQMRNTSRIGWHAVEVVRKEPHLALIRRLGTDYETGFKKNRSPALQIVPSLLIREETNEDVKKKFRPILQLASNDVFWLIGECQWGKIMKRSEPVDATFMDTSCNEISKQLFNSKKLVGYKKYTEFQESMIKWVHALLGEVEIGPGVSNKWIISVRVQLNDSGAIKRVILAEDVSTDQIWGVWTRWNNNTAMFGVERNLGTGSSTPRKTWKQGDLYMPKYVAVTDMSAKSEFWKRARTKPILLTSLNAIQMPLAGSFGPNALQWVADLVKNFDTSMFNAPSASTTVKAILDEKQKLKTSTKDGKRRAQAEVVYTDNKLKWYDANYTEWRVRELMYRKAQKVSTKTGNPLSYFKNGEESAILSEHANEINNVSFPSFEPMDEQPYDFSKWRSVAIVPDATIEPSAVGALEQYFFTAKSIVNIEISNPIQSIMEAFTNPYALQYLDLNGSTHVVWVLPTFVQGKNPNIKKVIVRDGLTMNERMTARSMGFEYESQQDKMSSMQNMMHSQMQMSMGSNVSKVTGVNPMDLNAPISVPTKKLRKMPWGVVLAVGIEWVWDMLPVSWQEKLALYFWDSISNIKKNIMSHKALVVSLCALVGIAGSQLFSNGLREWIYTVLGVSKEEKSAVESRFEKSENDSLGEVGNVLSSFQRDHPYITGVGAAVALGSTGFLMYNMRSTIKKWFDHNFWLRQGSDMGAVKAFYNQRQQFVNEELVQEFKRIEKNQSSKDSIDHLGCIRIVDQSIIQNVGQFEMKSCLLNLYLDALRMDQESASARPKLKSRLNFLFLGNPGTGKTTAAEDLFAKMLFSTGLRNNKYHEVKITATAPTIADIEKFAVNTKKGMNNIVSTAAAMGGAFSNNGLAGLAITAVFHGGKTWLRSEAPSAGPSDPYEVVVKGRKAWEDYEENIIASFLKATDSGVNFWSTSAAELLMKDNPAAALNKKIQEMVQNDGGVVFIDEAYTLKPASNKKGAQVYALILLASERHKDIISFILAGYKKDIEQELVSFNPGLARRFPTSVLFEDLSDADIREVINMKLRKSRSNATDIVPGWVMKDATIDIVVARLAKRKSFPGFGNFATVNQSYDSAVQAAGARLKLENKPVKQNHISVAPAGEETKDRDAPQTRGETKRRDEDEQAASVTASVTTLGAKFMPAEPLKNTPVESKFHENESEFQEITLEDVVGKQPSKNKRLQLLMATKIGMKNPETGTFGNYNISPETGFPEFSEDGKSPKFIGMDNVKLILQELVNSAEYNWLQESEGLPTVPIMLNKLFIGKPGTGKTEIAVLWAEIIKELHLLSDSSFVSKTASDFIGNVVGGSQTKTNAILKASMGKVLFIDEAYVLAESQFGLEVLNTIVEQVQANPGADRSVIMAGYPKEMNAMCRNVNPGLGRRFDSKFPVEFHDYSNESLAAIMSGMAKKHHIVLLEDARNFAIDEIAKRRPAKDFGNAGTINTFIDKAVKSAMTRCLESKSKWEKMKGTADPEYFTERGNIKIYGEMKYFTAYEKQLMLDEKIATNKKQTEIAQWQKAKILFLQGRYRENLMDATQSVVNSLEETKIKLQRGIDKTSKKYKDIKEKKKAWDNAKAALEAHQLNNHKAERIQSWIDIRTRYLTFATSKRQTLKQLVRDSNEILQKIVKHETKGTGIFGTWPPVALLYSQIKRKYQEMLRTFGSHRLLKIKLARKGTTTPKMSGDLETDVGGAVNFHAAVEKLALLAKVTSDDSAQYSRYDYGHPEHEVAKEEMKAIQKNVNQMLMKIQDIKNKADEATSLSPEELQQKADKEIKQQIKNDEAGILLVVAATKRDYFKVVLGGAGEPQANIAAVASQKNRAGRQKIKKAREILEHGERVSSDLKSFLQEVSLADGTEELALPGSRDIAKIVSISAIQKAIKSYNKNLCSAPPEPYKSEFQKLKEIASDKRDSHYDDKLQLFRTLEEKKQLFLEWTPSQLVLTKFDFGKCIRPDPIEKLRERRGEDDLVRYITSITQEYKVCKEIWPLDESKWPKASNIIFHGNSGTGKTDSANMLGEALKNAGLLVSGETTIRSASDLEGTVVGEAQKLVQEAMEEALGGILLIDEAYELGRSEYGRQAQTKLIAMLEEEKYNNGKVVVILCGYQDKMQKMMRRNQGMASRFGREFLFKDVEPNLAVVEITRRLREEYFITPVEDPDGVGETKSGSDETKYGTRTQVELCLGFFMKFLRESENFGNYRDCKTIAIDIKSNVYAKIIRGGPNVKTAQQNAYQQMKALKDKKKEKEEEANEELYAEFYPVPAEDEDEDPVEDVGSVGPLFTFMVQDVIDTCKQRALARLRKPKRSASYEQQETHKKIVSLLENISPDNFIGQFQNIFESKTSTDMRSEVLSSVKYDIAREEQMKSWLALQKGPFDESKTREEIFDEAIRDKTVRFMEAKAAAAERLKKEARDTKRQKKEAKEARDAKRQEEKERYARERTDRMAEHERLEQARQQAMRPVGGRPAAEFIHRETRLNF